MRRNDSFASAGENVRIADLFERLAIVDMYRSIDDKEDEKNEKKGLEIEIHGSRWISVGDEISRTKKSEVFVFVRRTNK